MTSWLTTILRRPDGLFGVVSRRLAEFEWPKPPEDIDESFVLAPPAEGPYVEEVRSLADVPDAIAPMKRRLLAAWGTLESVSTWSTETLVNVLRVLNDTIADPAVDTAAVPPLVIAEPVAPPRPTAAHPRAYRGTKYKPPKPPQTPPVDLRSHLCVPADEERILARLGPYLDEAAAQIEKEQPPESSNCDGPQAPGRCWTAEYRKQIAALPSCFRRHLLWSLRDRDWKDVSTVLSTYWALGLEQDTQLRRCVSVLLAVASQQHAAAWCGLIAKMPPARCVHFAELVNESQACQTELDEKTTSGLLRADVLSPDWAYRHRMYHALGCVAEGYSLSYVIDGFTLANEYRRDYTFEHKASLEGVGPAVKGFADFVEDADNWWPARAMTLWEHCSGLEGLKELLEDPAWRRLDPHSACRLLDTLVGVVFDELSEAQLEQKWRFVRGQAPHFIEQIESIRLEYRTKALDALRRVIDYWDDSPRLDRALKPFFRVLRRVCDKPFREDARVQLALSVFSGLPPEQWQVVEQAQDASFHKLESASRTKNAAWLIGLGLWSMCEVSPRLAAAAFDRCPRQLLRAAQTLGAIDTPVRQALIRLFAEHPLCRVDPATLDVRELAALVEAHVGPGTSNPIPRRLREHLHEGRPLRPAQAERDAGLIREGWLALQLDVLNQLAIERMAAGLPNAERSGKAEHAVMLQQMVSSNKRALRRLLKAYWSGDRDYAEKHPRNAEWLKKHPKLDPAKWQQGLSHRAEVRGCGCVELSIEQDALEVLRLGSYVGSCLGLGGDFSYSAVAVTLDINKRVVYARSGAGRVVGRQLLAVAEDDRLVCFEVYPKSIGRAMRTVFREFDQRLAAHLGLTIYEVPEDGREDEYEIAAIVSRDFWDDGAWDLNVKDDWQRWRERSRRGAGSTKANRTG
jgi:hypothetical protein